VHAKDRLFDMFINYFNVFHSTFLFLLNYLLSADFVNSILPCADDNFNKANKSEMSLFNLIFLNFTTSFLQSCFENEHSFTTLKVKRTCKKYDLKWSEESYFNLGKSL
jgi:hypothetical protein